MQFDPFRQVLRKGRLARGNRSPSQRAKLWYVQNVLLKATDKARVRMPEQPALSAPNFDSLPRDVGAYLLQAAIQAPSGDNAQPWRFRLTGNDIHVFLNPETDVSFFNVRQIASIIACGAALENIRIAAASMGLVSSVQILPEGAQENLMATARIQPGEQAPDPLARHIWTRCTNRRPYKKRPLPDWGAGGPQGPHQGHSRSQAASAHRPRPAQETRQGDLPGRQDPHRASGPARAFHLHDPFQRPRKPGNAVMACPSRTWRPDCPGRHSCA